MDTTETVTFEVTDFMLEKFKDVFDLDIELLQGEYTKLPNDMHRYKIQLTGYKLEMFKDFVRMMMSVPSEKIKVEYFGTNINPN
jgi:hypothetical protein